MTTRILDDTKWTKMYSYLRLTPQIYTGNEQKTRMFVETVYWVMRAGAPWRDLPAEFCKWNSAFNRFAESAQLYEQLIAQEMGSGAIYYNLGNAYYQQGELGKAILNYNRALALDPRDMDIQANLALARAQAVDQFGIETQDDIYSIFTTAVSNNLTLNQTAVLALIFWFVLAIAIIAIRQMQAGKLRTWLKMGTAVAGVFFLIATFSLGSRLYEQINTEPAVIVVPEVNVTTGPGEQFATQFTLHSGAEVELVEARGQWAKLALPGGETTGWLPAEAIAAVN